LLKYHFNIYNCSLAGFLSNIGVMFYLSWLYGLIGSVILLSVFVYLVIMAPERNWGDVSQAIMFHQVRKYLLMLDTNKQHSKFWRPNILLLMDSPAASIIGFCNNLKKGGLLLLGQAIVGNFTEAIRLSKVLKPAWNTFLKNYKIKGFTQFAVDTDYRRAVQSLMLGSGLGGLSSNTVCVPLLKTKPVVSDSNIRAAHGDAVIASLSELPSATDLETSELCNSYDGLPVPSYTEYCGMLHDVLQYEHNLLVACNFEGGMHKHKNAFKVAFTSPRKFTDIWVIGDFAIVHSATGTVHSLWGYASSPYHAHVAHPFLTIPPPLEAGDGVFDPSTLDVTVGMEGLTAFLIQLGAIAEQTRVGLDGKRLATDGHNLRIFHVPSSVAGPMDAATEREGAIAFIKQICLRARLQVLDENIFVFMLLGLLF
jgi:hypothetical protein